MVDAFQTKAMETRLSIPIIYGIDAVHGHNNVKGAVIFPHNIGLGCTWNDTLVESAFHTTAVEVAGTGIHWTFAPCVAVPQDERWGRTYEGFGEIPEIVRRMSRAGIVGLQGNSLSQNTAIAACAKHYVGDVGTTNGIDQGNVQMNEAELRAIHLTPYVEAVEANVATVMVSFSSWNGQKMHGNHYLLTEVLKEELGFEGVVVSDMDGIHQLAGDYTSNVKESILAGIDMSMERTEYAAFISALKSLVNSGDIPIERINDAVSRILELKFKLGLFENPYADRSLADSVGCRAHRDIARQCVRESMVLLHKQNGVLPLNPNQGKILVASHG